MTLSGDINKMLTWINRKIINFNNYMLSLTGDLIINHSETGKFLGRKKKKNQFDPFLTTLWSNLQKK